MRYSLEIEYEGSAFSGWQEQPGRSTGQSVLEAALFTVLRHPVKVVAAGRTDAGVHARGQVVHFDAPALPEPLRLLRSLNALTPPTLAVRKLYLRDPEWHARYSALGRVYIYRLSTQPQVLESHVTWQLRCPLQPAFLKSELDSLLGTQDFKPFSLPREDGKSTLCTLKRVEVKCEAYSISILLEANRFLHRMVRSLIGAAVDVSRGAHAPGFMRETLERGLHKPWTWAPAHGLCLEQIVYPADNSICLAEENVYPDSHLAIK